MGSESSPMRMEYKQDPKSGNFLGVELHKKDGSTELRPLRMIPDTKKKALVELIFSPLWIPIKSLWAILMSFLDIISFGTLAARTDKRYTSFRGRVKAIGYDLLRLLASPVAIAGEVTSVFYHIFSPGLHKIDKVLTRLWTGGSVW